MIGRSLYRFARPAGGCVAIALFATLLAGCHGGKLWLNPWHRPDRTTLVTPAKQAAEIRALATRSTGEDTPEQQEVVTGLVRTLQEEQDPLLREVTLQTVAKFNTPLARQALLAGLNDADPSVRVACCELLGQRPGAEVTPQLARVAQEDSEFDVRVAAVRALGSATDDAARAALVTVLEDNDPAMQMVGVEAMKKRTGRDLGGDVSAYLALAKGEEPAPTTRVAERDWLPFF
ncbi:MAG: HEAT repeat domain-containing protein [Lacipirellulaceae bacterium]